MLMLKESIIPRLWHILGMKILQCGSILMEKNTILRYAMENCVQTITCFSFLVNCVDTSVAQTRFGGSVCFGVRRERNKKPIWFASVGFH